jgi:hypothetical protein
MKNDTTKDDVGSSRTEGTQSDMPAILGLGAEYGLAPNLRASLSFIIGSRGVDWPSTGPGTSSTTTPGTWDSASNMTSRRSSG